MPDREKVIKGLEQFKDDFKPFCGNDADWARVDDAIDMLKEKEPKKVEWRIGRAHCPSCGELFPRKKETQHIRFCNFCGQEVEWDEKL